MSKAEIKAKQDGEYAKRRGFIGSVYCQYGSTHPLLWAAWMAGNA